MDILRGSVLNTLGYYEHLELFGRDLDDTEKTKTSFNIISAFALKNGTIDFDLSKIRSFTTEQFTRQLYDRLDLPPVSQTEHWHQRLAEEGLLEAKPQDTTATLNVIYVHTHSSPLDGLSEEAFRNLFTTFGLDHSFLHSLCRWSDTWHCIRRDDGICTFLLTIQSVYSMACTTFFPKGPETNCVIFGRAPRAIEIGLDLVDFNFYQPSWFRRPSTPDGQTALDNQTIPGQEDELDMRTEFEPRLAFQKLLVKFQPYHLHHPLSIAYLGLVDNLSILFIRVSKAAESIYELKETVTDVSNDMDHLFRVSRDSGNANLTLALISRSMGVALMLLEELEHENGWREWCRKFVPTDSESQYGVVAKWLAEGLPSCRQILKNETLQNSSQEDRLRALTPIGSCHPIENISGQIRDSFKLILDPDICKSHSRGHILYENHRSHDYGILASNSPRRCTCCTLGAWEPDDPECSRYRLCCCHSLHDNRGVSNLEKRCEVDVVVSIPEPNGTARKFSLSSICGSAVQRELATSGLL